MNFNENKAIYLQLSDRIMDSILSGQYTAGGRIPSVREFAASVEVNPNTVVRSYEYLEQKGVVYNKRGLGYFVSDDANELILSMRRSVFYADELPYFFERISSFGWTPESLAEEFRNYCNKQK